MRKHGNLSILVCVVLLVGMMTVSTANNRRVDTSDEIKDLMMERRDALRERATAVDAEYRSGRSEVAKVLDAQKDLLDAELELAPNRERRIALRRETLETLKVAELLAQAQFEQGVNTIQERLEAKAARIACKIDLLREQGEE